MACFYKGECKAAPVRSKPATVSPASIKKEILISTLFISDCLLSALSYLIYASLKHREPIFHIVPEEISVHYFLSNKLLIQGSYVTMSNVMRQKH